MSIPHFSQAAENNKDVILAELKRILCPKAHVLEIASGTGQHADHFTAAMPDIVWQPSDRSLTDHGLEQNLSNNSRSNLLKPFVIDINRWPDLPRAYDAVYSANCIHIISFPSLESYIRGAANALKSGGALIMYGPFKYGGAFTTESNSRFDTFLRKTYPGSGIRDFEAVDELAQKERLVFEEDMTMPANNQLLTWRKRPASSRC